MAEEQPTIQPKIEVDPKVLNLNRWGTSREVAEFSGCSIDALRLQRYRGTGARFSRHGRVIRYWMADVHEHLCKGLSGGES
jgi:hypothetical protein